MPKNFLTDTSQTSTIPVSPDAVASHGPSQEPVKLLVIGSRARSPQHHLQPVSPGFCPSTGMESFVTWA